MFDRCTGQQQLTALGQSRPDASLKIGKRTKLSPDCGCLGLLFLDIASSLLRACSMWSVDFGEAEYSRQFLESRHRTHMIHRIPGKTRAPCY